MNLFSWILFFLFGAAYAWIAYYNRTHLDSNYKKIEYPVLGLAIISLLMAIFAFGGEEPPVEVAIEPEPTVEVLEATPLPTPTKQLSEIKFIPDQEVAERQKVVRQANLVKYNSEYTGKGWCALWDQMFDEQLIELASGQESDDETCPEDIKNEVTGEVVTENVAETVVIGVQILNTSRIIVNFPACIEFGGEGDYFNKTGGLVKNVDNETQVGTNIIVEPNSFFTFYFRCDENYFE